LLNRLYSRLVGRRGGAPAKTDASPPAAGEETGQVQRRAAVQTWMAADDFPAYDWAALSADPLREQFAFGLARGIDAEQIQPLLNELSVRAATDALDGMLCADALLHYRLFSEAESLLKALAGLPDRIGARASALLAQRLFNRGEFARARELAESAVRLAPEAMQCQITLGQVREYEGRHDEAIAHFRRACALRPASTMALGQLSVALLGRGEIAEGMRTWAMVDYLSGLYPRMDACPVWDGRPLGRDHLLIVTYFGFGDIIQFMRFASLLRKREPAARLSIAVPGPLLRLAIDSGLFDAVHEDGVDRLQFDWQVTQTQLTLLLGVSIREVSDFEPYLRIPPARAAIAETWLPPRRLGRKRVGLRWAGRDLPFNAKRSIPFDLLRPLFAIPNIDWVALAESAEQMAAIKDHPLLDATAHMHDFADTGALACNLDLVLSVDTSVVHLAAALALPVWLMARPDYEWRWGNEGVSPWYRSVRIFRHGDAFDWSAMVAEVEGALRLWVAEPSIVPPA
jgi:tetratricopeptide (TPR) repeat protein